MRRLSGCLAAVALAGACAPAPVVPESPTWADVEPILRGACTSCHGGSAPTAGSAGGITYRLDFYDMTPERCGDATLAAAGTRFAAASSSQIASDITSVSASIRPRMPPEPSPWLADWEWQTLLRWAADPVRGPTPARNRPPSIRITSPPLRRAASAARVVRRNFTLEVVIEDPDGESAVGVLTLGDVTLRLDRPGAFAITIDAGQWGPGPFTAQAVVCDGWTRVAYDLGDFLISG